MYQYHPIGGALLSENGARGPLLRFFRRVTIKRTSLESLSEMVLLDVCANNCSTVWSKHPW